VQIQDHDTPTAVAARLIPLVERFLADSADASWTSSVRRPAALMAEA
jgi:hypothetical protein